MADHTRTRLTRRDLLLALAPAGAVLLAGGTVRGETALPHLDENDPAAKSLFPGKLVNANGWCKVWVAKP